MKRPLLLGLGIVVLTGCGANKTARNDPTNHVDADSIAETPLPAIKPDTYVAAGDLAASRAQFGRAAAQYEAALKVQPDDGETLRKLALVCVKGNAMPAAIDAWKRYAKAVNNTDDAYGSLGYTYELAGKPADAEATYQAGIAAHPDGPLTHVNYGLMLVRRNHVEEAVKQLSAVLKPPEVNYNIASVYAELGRKDLAQFYYKRAIQCDPDFLPAREKLAAVQ